MTPIAEGTQFGPYRLIEKKRCRKLSRLIRGCAKAPDAQAGLLLTGAAARGLAGLCAENESTVQQALALDKSRQTQETAVLAAAVCGNGKVALPMALDLSEKYPEDTLIQGLYQPLAKAFVALAAGRAQEAVDAAEPAKPWDAVSPGSYVQGLAYLQLHDERQRRNTPRFSYPSHPKVTAVVITTKQSLLPNPVSAAR